MTNLNDSLLHQNHPASLTCPLSSVSVILYHFYSVHPHLTHFHQFIYSPVLLRSLSFRCHVTQYCCTHSTYSTHLQPSSGCPSAAQEPFSLVHGSHTGTTSRRHTPSARKDSHVEYEAADAGLDLGPLREKEREREKERDRRGHGEGANSASVALVFPVRWHGGGGWRSTRETCCRSCASLLRWQGMGEDVPGIICTRPIRLVNQ